MAFAAPLDNALALNPQGLDALRSLASRGNTPEGAKAAATQFESYFMNLMLRSMRETLPQDGPFDSQETRTFTEMFDQQIAQKAAQSKGLGLADMIVAQFSGLMDADGARKSKQVQVKPSLSSEQSLTPTTNSEDTQVAPGSFVDRLWPHAVDAAKSLGVSPHFLVAHAALETGWGKRELKTADGSASNNLFNIKAGTNWKGKTVDAEVTEFVNGKPVKSMEKFRAYNSPAESFSDYASLLGNDARYSKVLNQDAEGFIQGLQQGGFATDPAYADKLRRVIGSAALRTGMKG
jgi:flagellar protein FlgJ